MLSINRLGNLGRLANQMFQYASTKGIASHRGYSFSIPPKDAFGAQDELVSQSDVTIYDCLLYTSPSPRDRISSRMPSSA